MTGHHAAEQGPDPLFAGVGGVAADMAAVDWAATPLGPSREWPPALRGVVRMLLTSRFAMWMAWGPELTMFYNDTYQRDTLRTKHPWALGRPSSEVWAEVWDDVTEQVRSVFEQGRATWDENLELYLERRGWPEETYHTFSYSPVGDEDGTVRGLLCVVTETTDSVLAGRRLAFLRDLATATTTARSARDVAAAAHAVLADGGRDLPAGLLYLLDPADPGAPARLCAAVGVIPGGAAAPETVGPDDGPWPLHRALGGERDVVVEVPAALADRVPARCDRVVLEALPGEEDGEPLGVLVLGLSRHLAFDEPYRDFVHLVAGQVSAALLDARTAESERRQAQAERVAARRLALVHRATSGFSAAATPVEVAQVAAVHVAELLGPSARVAVFEYDEAGRTLRALARQPAEPDPESHGDVVGLDRDTVVTRAVRAERALWIHEPEPGEREDAQDPALLALLRARGFSKSIAMPLVAAGRVVGALGVGLTGRGRLDESERTTLSSLAEPCAVALDRARIYRADHEIARTLQRSLLPQALPEVDELPLAVRYVPGAAGTSAGGDWYDAVVVDGTRVAIVVGDVVGQGTAAAAVMGQLRTALSGYLLAGHGPGPALDLLDVLVGRVPGARASTAICVVVDTATGMLRWARAGHLPALLVEADAARLLDDPAGHGPLLGLDPCRRVARTEGTATIAPGTAVVLYTDGLVERRGESLDEGLARLVDVAGACGDREPEGLASALLAGLAPDGATDDVAVLAVRLAPQVFTHRLAAAPEALGGLRRAVRSWAASAGLADRVLEDLQLALGEAATNAVEHAWGDHPPADARVTVGLRLCPGGVAVEVRDHGRWRPVPADPGCRGRGLALIRALATDVVVDGAHDGTRVTFTVPGAPPEPVAAATRAPAGARDAPALITVDPGPVPRVTVRGDLDLAGATWVRRRLEEAGLPGTRPWTLDLTGVGYLTSSGVGLLLTCAEQGAEVVLPTTGPAARVVALCGIPAAVTPA